MNNKPWKKFFLISTRNNMLYRFFQVFFYMLMKIVYRVEVHGLNQNFSDEKYIIVANHKSIIDPVLISAYFKPQIFWMAKKELFASKLFGAFLTKLGAFPIDREATDIKSIKTAMRHLRENEIVGIFPEGTRVDSVNYDMVKAGVALISHKAHATIQPVYIKGGYAPFRKVHLYFREPFRIEVEKKLTNEEYEYLSQDIMRRVYGEKEKYGSILS